MPRPVQLRCRYSKCPTPLYSETRGARKQRLCRNGRCPESFRTRASWSPPTATSARCGQTSGSGSSGDRPRGFPNPASRGSPLPRPSPTPPAPARMRVIPPPNGKGTPPASSSPATSDAVGVVVVQTAVAALRANDLTSSRCDGLIWPRLPGGQQREAESRQVQVTNIGLSTLRLPPSRCSPEGTAVNCPSGTSPAHHTAFLGRSLTTRHKSLIYLWEAPTRRIHVSAAPPADFPGSFLQSE